jgi:hypothetical protein
VAHRLDLTRIDATTRLPNGGLRIDATPTRAGVLEYSDGAGNSWKEWRPPEEVFAPASLATLKAATVTDLHPEEMVTPDNWRALSKGHTGDDVRRVAGDLVGASVIVQDAAEVGMVERGERVELSCGYSADIDETPGITPEGEAYDRVQRNIRYNHVALGPPDWGRAGPQCSLRVDAGAAVARPRTPRSVRADAPAKERSTMKIRVGKKTFEIRTDADMPPGADEPKPKADDAAALQSAIEALEASLTKALGDLAAAKAQMNAQAAMAAAPPANSAEAGAPDDTEPPDDASLDSFVAKREAKRADAKLVLGADADVARSRRGDRGKRVIAHVSARREARLARRDGARGADRRGGRGREEGREGRRTEHNDALVAGEPRAAGDPTSAHRRAGEPEDVMAKNREAQRADARKKAL